MKNLITIVTLFVLPAFCFAQTTAQQEIDQQVWKPFTGAIMTQDVEKFASLHSKDLVRAERNSKRVLNFEQYKEGMQKNWPGWKANMEKNKTKYTFELRFTERISNETTAYEVGYFKNEMINAAGEKNISYGKFHVVLRKENGIWKILVDSDSNEGGKITDEEFLAAKPVGH